MKQRTKLQICLVCNFLLLLVVIILMVEFESNSKYCRIGPQKDLIVIAVKINTYSRYVVLLGIITFIKISKVVIEELGMPVLGFSIYNPDKKVITDFTKMQLQLYGNAMWFLDGFKRLMLIMVSITQIDLALVGMLSSEIMSIFTIRLLLNEKTFPLDEQRNSNAEMVIEEEMKILSRRSVVALNDITKGELFSEKNVGMRRPGNGLEPIMIEKILGQKAKQKILKGK